MEPGQYATGQAPVHATVTVERGTPTEAELAAVIVVLAARASAASSSPGTPAARSLWSARSRQLRPALFAGPGAWRASTLP